MSRSALAGAGAGAANRGVERSNEFCSPEDLAQDYTLNIVVFRVQGGGLI